MISYVVVPLGEIIDRGYDNEKIENAFKKFSCQREEDLEDFLIRKSITYERADIGKTYLCIDKEKLENGEFVVLAYFTLAQRSVDISDLPNKRKRKALGDYPGRDQMKSVPAFLIGQLGRSDDCSSEDLSGQQILNECYHAISLAARVVGGKGVDKKLWYICLLFLLIVIIYYISTGGIHMDDIKSPSAVTIGELSRIVKEFEEKIQNGTEDPNRFLTLTEIEELWGRLIGDTNVLYSDMVQSLIQNIDERGLVRQKKENSRPEE